MNSIEWRRLDATAREYVRERICDAGLSLSRSLLPDLEVVNCEVWAALPRDASREAAHDLLDGISATTPVLDPLDAPVSDWLQRMLTGGPGRFLIVEHMMWAPGDAFAGRVPNLVRLGDELFTITRGSVATPSAVDDEVGWVSYQEVALLVSDLSDEAVYAGVGTLRSDVVDQLRGHVLAVIVEAYDAEGYVVLCVDGTCPRPD